MTRAHAVIAAPPPWERERYLHARLRPDPADLHRARQVARPGASRPGAAALRARRPRLPVTKIVFATQVVDPDDANLGAVVGKLRALAARVDEVARPRRPCGRGSAARELPRPPLRRPLAQRARSTVPGGAAARARRAAARGRRAQRPALRHPRRPALPAAAGAGPALVHALEAQPDARPRRAALDGRRQRRSAVVPARLGQGGRDRPRDRHRRLRLRAPRAGASACGRSRSAAPRPQRGCETIARACELAEVELEVLRTLDHRRGARRAGPPARARRPAARSDPLPARCGPCSPGGTSSSTTCARARSTRSSTRQPRPACRCWPQTAASTTCSRPSSASTATTPTSWREAA